MCISRRTRYQGIAIVVAALGMGTLGLLGRDTADAQEAAQEPPAAASPAEVDVLPADESEAVMEEEPVLESDAPLLVESTCFWEGTAPWCDGACPLGYVGIRYDSCGDGYCCWVGWKVLCCPS